MTSIFWALPKLPSTTSLFLPEPQVGDPKPNCWCTFCLLIVISHGLILETRKMHFWWTFVECHSLNGLCLDSDFGIVFNTILLWVKPIKVFFEKLTYNSNDCFNVSLNCKMCLFHNPHLYCLKLSPATPLSLSCCIVCWNCVTVHLVPSQIEC